MKKRGKLYTCLGKAGMIYRVSMTKNGDLPLGQFVGIYGFSEPFPFSTLARIRARMLRVSEPFPFWTPYLLKTHLFNYLGGNMGYMSVKYELPQGLEFKG